MDTKENFKHLEKFHKLAKLKKDNVSQDIKLIHTCDGDFSGFTYTEETKLVKIFLDDDCVVLEKEGEEESSHEIGLYEL
jgi:hypothetical protein